MKTIMKITIISIVLVIILLGMVGCASSISPEEYNQVKNELNDVKLQAAELQNKLDEAETAVAQYDQLNSQFQELKNQYDAQADEIRDIQSDFTELNADYSAATNEIQGLQADYDSLVLDYNELKQQYDIAVKKYVFSEQEVNQAIFTLVNQERRNSGLDELQWGVNLYGWARQNSISMSETGEFKYTAWLTRQAVLITAGQSTLEELINGIMLVWKQQKHEFTPKFLDPKSPYGAVAAYKLGDVYYITFVAATDP